MIANQQVIAEHQRSFKKHSYRFEPRHYVQLLKQKPGALRDGAPFEPWDLPEPIITIKNSYLKRDKGDRGFVELLQLMRDHDVDTISIACECAIEAKTTQLSAIINLVHRLIEPDETTGIDVIEYPELKTPPQANCQRYNQLLSTSAVA